MVELEGTEKQITWAKSIKEEKIKSLEDFKEYVKTSTKSDFCFLMKAYDPKWEECFPNYKEGLNNKVSLKRQFAIEKAEIAIDCLKKLKNCSYIIGLKNVNDIDLIFPFFNPQGQYVNKKGAK